VGNEQMLISGGSLITGYGVQEADLWIKGGKIVRRAKDTLRKRHANGRGKSLLRVFDASGYYILPGFVHVGQMRAHLLSNVRDYLDDIRDKVAGGFTTMVDTVRVERWMDVEQLLYHLTPHYNNVIDYAIELEYAADEFTPQRVAAMARRGFRLFRVVIRQPQEARQLQWDSLYPVFQKYKLAVQPEIQQAERLTRTERNDILEIWLGACHYGKIRTRVKDVDPFQLHGEERFYTITEIVEGEHNRLLRYLHKFGHLPLPVCSRADRIRGLKPARQWTPEQVLNWCVRIAAANTAKAIGCYPVKGSLLPGADADLVFIKKQDWLTNFAVSTILNFSEICQPAMVMSRGRWLLRGGNYQPLIGTGNHLLQLKPYNYVI